jgi:hypothetical protein
MRGKYIKTIDNEIILFPEHIMHSDFRNLKPISAGFFYYESSNYIVCHGHSISLNLSSDVNDSEIANRQFNNN